MGSKLSKEELMRYVPDVTFEMIPIKNLVSNQDYQRNVSSSHIQKAVNDFDLRQVNPVKVSRRKGINYVFNGQHTAEIIAAVSGSRETPVWCMVFHDLDYSDEADVFANQMKHVKPLLPIEIFKANLEAGDEIALTIKALVEANKLSISPTKRPNSICAVSTLEKIYKKYGYHCLDRTLKLLVATWEGDPMSMTSSMLMGTAKLINTFQDELNNDLFIEKLGVVSCKELIRTAKERKAGSVGYAEAMLVFYNKKMKFGLSLSKLYSNKKINDITSSSDESDDFVDSAESNE